MALGVSNCNHRDLVADRESQSCSVSSVSIKSSLSSKHNRMIPIFYFSPSSFSHFNDISIGRYVPDGLTERITLHEFPDEHSLLETVQEHIQAFTSPSGCVLFLYSCLFTRDLEK